MKKVVERQRNKGYYRVLHVPIWVWVFFVLPGHLTYELYLHGPNRQHGIWLALVLAGCAFRGFRGRLPGVEPKPYITHYGVHQPNLPYRVVCYTGAWIDLLVPYLLNLLGLAAASFTGVWALERLYAWLYYPMALAIIAATFFDLIPRAKRSTIGEGAEKAWFYVTIWTVVPTQVVAWGAWRLGSRVGLDPLTLSRFRFGVFIAVTVLFLTLGLRQILPRTQRYYTPMMPATGGM
jgi:hypothetical protein